MFKLSDVKTKATTMLNEYRQQDPAAYAAAQQAVGGILILDGFIGIDNPLGGKKRPGIFGSVVGMVISLIFIGIGFFGSGLFGINHLTAQTTATVVSVGPPSATTTNSDGSTSGGACSMSARYTVGGKQYTGKSNMSSSSYCGRSIGSSISINYDPAQPAKWATDVGMVKNIMKIFGFAGILFLLSSLFTFVLRLLSIIFGWKLLRSGRALAKTLPGGADMAGMIADIRTHFTQLLHGGTAALQPAAAGPASAVPVQPVSPAAAPYAPAPPIPSPQPAAGPIQPAPSPEQTEPVPPQETPPQPPSQPQ